MSGRRLVIDQSGSSAAEFALVLVPLLAMLFGVIDGGRWLWECNQAEKATQAGARVAVVTDLIPSGLASTFVGKTVNGVTLTQGDLIPAGALGKVVCQKATDTLDCTCDTCTGITLTPLVSTGWDKIVERVRALDPNITEDMIRVEYSGSGLGYAGDPSGLDVSPLVTVKVEDLKFRPLTTFAFSALEFPMPAFQTTLTAEDVAGTRSE